MSKEPENHKAERAQGEHEQQEHERQQRAAQAQQAQPGQPGQAQPGTKLPNPAQPYAPTDVPVRPDASSFMRAGYAATHPDGYPKLKYHPVHGGIEVKDQGEEAGLYPKTDWFDTPELADAARTHTEAEQVRFHNQIVKLHELEEKEHPIVRNSVQSDEAVRRAQTEPL
jgi:hypothetical protein